MKRKWNEQEIEYLINNYSNERNEDLAKILNRSIKSIAKKANLLNIIKSKEHKSNMIGKRNKMVGRDLSYDNLKLIANKYKTRGEFQLKDSSAYTVARINFGLNDICSHMIKQNYSTPQLLLCEILKIIFINDIIIYNDKNIIKPYELDIYIPKYKLAFEYNGKIWHKNNKKDNIKKELCINNNINLITINENSRNYVKDINEQLINNLNLINKICSFNIKNNDIKNIDEYILYDKIKFEILDINDIKNIINKYSNYHDFIVNENKVYNLLKKNKLLEKYTSELKKTKINWTYDKIIYEISKYTEYTDFLNKSKGCYLFIKRNKLEYLLDNLNRNCTMWTFDKIKEISIKNNIKTSYKLKKYYCGAFNYIKRNNLIFEYRQFLETIKKPD